MNTDTPLPAALQRVQELHREGHKQRDIAKILEAEGVPLLPGRSKKWNQPGVRAALQQLEAQAPAPPPPLPPTSPPPPPSIAAVPIPAEVDPSPPEPTPAPKPAPLPPHSLKVKILGPWTRTDSLLWDFLIHKVWEELGQKAAHTLPLQDGLNGLRAARGRSDRAHLWDALDRLAASRVKLEGQLDKQHLAISTPLLSAALTQKTLAFQFPDALIRLVKNPQQYTRLQALFGVKH